MEIAFATAYWMQIDGAPIRLGALAALPAAAFLIVHLYDVADFRLLPYFALLAVWYGYLVAQTQRFISSAIVHALHNMLAMLVAYVGLPDTLLGFSRLGYFWLGLLAIGNFFAVNLLAKQWIKALGPTGSAPDVKASTI